MKNQLRAIVYRDLFSLKELDSKELNQVKGGNFKPLSTQFLQETSPILKTGPNFNTIENLGVQTPADLGVVDLATEIANPSIEGALLNAIVTLP